MKKKNVIHLSPEFASDKCLAFFTESVDASESILVSVPPVFKAILLLDGKIARRIDTCEKVELSSLVDLSNVKTVSIAYIYRKASMKVAFGFGNIACDLIYDKDYELTDGYLVGANGSYSVSVYDYASFIYAFVGYREVTVMSVRERVNAILRGLGMRYLPVFLSEQKATYDNIGTLTDGFSKAFAKIACMEKEIDNIGIKLESLTIDGIVANEK